MARLERGLARSLIDFFLPTEYLIAQKVRLITYQALQAMLIDSEWEFVGTVPDGQPFKIGGLDVWQHTWKDTQERANIKDPYYNQEFTFYVYEIGRAENPVIFAAGEFSNCIWGFYIRK